jgi:hypothetical protein
MVKEMVNFLHDQLHLETTKISLFQGEIGLVKPINQLKSIYQFLIHKGTMVYKSKLLRYLLTMFYFPSYLLGRFDQKQTLNLILKDNFVDNPVRVFYYSFFLKKHTTI